VMIKVLAGFIFILVIGGVAFAISTISNGNQTARIPDDNKDKTNKGTKVVQTVEEQVQALGKNIDTLDSKFEMTALNASLDKIRDACTATELSVEETLKPLSDPIKNLVERLAEEASKEGDAEQALIAKKIEDLIKLKLVDSLNGSTGVEQIARRVKEKKDAEEKTKKDEEAGKKTEKDVNKKTEKDINKTTEKDVKKETEKDVKNKTEEDARKKTEEDAKKKTEEAKKAKEKQLEELKIAVSKYNSELSKAQVNLTSGACSELLKIWNDISEKRKIFSGDPIYKKFESKDAFKTVIQPLLVAKIESLVLDEANAHPEVNDLVVAEIDKLIDFEKKSFGIVGKNRALLIQKAVEDLKKANPKAPEEPANLKDFNKAIGEFKANLAEVLKNPKDNATIKACKDLETLWNTASDLFNGIVATDLPEGFEGMDKLKNDIEAPLIARITHLVHDYAKKTFANESFVDDSAKKEMDDLVILGIKLGFNLSPNLISEMLQKLRDDTAKDPEDPAKNQLMADIAEYKTKVTNPDLDLSDLKSRILTKVEDLAKPEEKEQIKEFKTCIESQKSELINAITQRHETSPNFDKFLACFKEREFENLIFGLCFETSGDDFPKEKQDRAVFVHKLLKDMIIKKTWIEYKSAFLADLSTSGLSFKISDSQIEREKLLLTLTGNNSDHFRPIVISELISSLKKEDPKKSYICLTKIASEMLQFVKVEERRTLTIIATLTIKPEKLVALIDSLKDEENKQIISDFFQWPSLSNFEAIMVKYKELPTEKLLAFCNVYGEISNSLFPNDPAFNQIICNTLLNYVKGLLTPNVTLEDLKDIQRKSSMLHVGDAPEFILFSSAIEILQRLFEINGENLSDFVSFIKSTKDKAIYPFANPELFQQSCYLNFGNIFVKMIVKLIADYSLQHQIVDIQSTEYFVQLGPLYSEAYNVLTPPSDLSSCVFYAISQKIQDKLQKDLAEIKNIKILSYYSKMLAPEKIGFLTEEETEEKKKLLSEIESRRKKIIDDSLLLLKSIPSSQTEDLLLNEFKKEKSFKTLDILSSGYVKILDVTKEEQISAINSFINSFENISETFDESQKLRGSFLIKAIPFRQKFPFLDNNHFSKIVDNILLKSDFVEILHKIEEEGRMDLFDVFVTELLEFCQNQCSATDRTIISTQEEMLKFYHHYAGLFKSSRESDDKKELFAGCRANGFSFEAIKIPIETCVSQNTLTLCAPVISCYKECLALETSNFFGITLDNFQVWLDKIQTVDPKLVEDLNIIIDSPNYGIATIYEDLESFRKNNNCYPHDVKGPQYDGLVKKLNNKFVNLSKTIISTLKSLDNSSVPIDPEFLRQINLVASFCFGINSKTPDSEETFRNDIKSTLGSEPLKLSSAIWSNPMVATETRFLSKCIEYSGSLDLKPLVNDLLEVPLVSDILDVDFGFFKGPHDAFAKQFLSDPSNSNNLQILFNTLKTKNLSFSKLDKFFSIYILLLLKSERDASIKSNLHEDLPIEDLRTEELKVLLKDALKYQSFFQLRFFINSLGDNKFDADELFESFLVDTNSAQNRLLGILTGLSYSPSELYRFIYTFINYKRAEAIVIPGEKHKLDRVLSDLRGFKEYISSQTPKDSSVLDKFKIFFQI
jgi:hypothetical protein